MGGTFARKMCTYAMLRNRQTNRQLPFTLAEYKSLVAAIPDEWSLIIDQAATLAVDTNLWRLDEIARHMPHPPGTWLNDEEGRVGEVVS